MQLQFQTYSIAHLNKAVHETRRPGTIELRREGDLVALKPSSFFGRFLIPGILWRHEHIKPVIVTARLVSAHGEPQMMDSDNGGPSIAIVLISRPGRDIVTGILNE